MNAIVSSFLMTVDPYHSRSSRAQQILSDDGLLNRHWVPMYGLFRSPTIQNWTGDGAMGVEWGHESEIESLRMRLAAERGWYGSSSNSWKGLIRRLGIKCY